MTEDRIVSIFCRVTQGSQGKYSQLSLSPTVTLMNATNVNDPSTVSIPDCTRHQMYRFDTEKN
jgi:hypothetical protein